MKMSAALLGVVLSASALSAQSLQNHPLQPVDGSFLVNGLVQKRDERPKAPAVVVPQVSTSRMKPQFRCPMVTVEADPKIDPTLAKMPPANVQFTIRTERPSCTAR